ncbi:MAG: 4Fe-4S dicluster domain-containing protein [Candidatus Omnitrophica bacterium]|nr:4Fe-4S dicluster domain-containing protein [Candidatus Omnitrophota bacterium]MDD5574056.1 4Fe-4S dicluster domain-containing protein [Candidatus Omnitrophota bacterium]
MAEVRINRQRCKSCRLCIVWCPKKNLKIDETLNDAGVFPAVVIDAASCTGCGMCFAMCPDSCIEIKID